jgi:fumarate reductase flavoprotein subunit
MYRYHTPSGDKSCDGLAMALRAGLALRDIEMVQFHPTGLFAGDDTRMTGTVLEEGLRGAGGWLLDGKGERFMFAYDGRGERATRDIVSRAIQDQIRSGNGTANGGVYLQMSHLGPDSVRAKFKGMVERCADCGFDLAGGRVEVVPTAHYMMGGVVFNADCTTAMPRLFAAGEDTGGVHGANRLGGNGVANSTVFGGLAGDAMAGFTAHEKTHAEPDGSLLEQALERAFAPFDKPPVRLEGIRQRLLKVMWDDAGILRDAGSLRRAALGVSDLAKEIAEAGVEGDSRCFNLTWMDRLNLENLVLTSRAIIAAAMAREDSRGAHFREDFPETSALETSTYTVARLKDDDIDVTAEPVIFTRLTPGRSLLQAAE